MGNGSAGLFVIAKNPKGKMRTTVVNGATYYSLMDIGHAIGIGNPHGAKPYLDEKEIYRGSSKSSPTFISVRNVLRLLFYAKNNVLSDFVSWLINVLLPFEIKNELIQVTKTDEAVSPKQPNIEFVDDEELDEDSYAILNKELRKQILVFEREILKAEQVFMDIGDLLDSANELIDPENIKKNATN